MQKMLYAYGSRPFPAVLLIVFLGCWPTTLQADDPLRFRMRVSFSDEKVLYGDVFFAQIEVLSLGSTVAAGEPTLTGDVLSYSDAYYDTPVPNGVSLQAIQVKGSRTKPVIVMLRALKSRFLLGEPLFEIVDDVLRVVPPPIDPSMLPPGGLQLVSELVWIEQSFSWRTFLTSSSKLPTQGPIERSISSTYRMPVRGFAFVVREIQQLKNCIQQLHYNEQNEPALVNGDAFPLDLIRWESILDKIDHRSNLAQLVANSRSYTAALTNQQLTDDQFLAECILLVKRTKPIARDWLARVIEQDLSMSRPKLVTSYRHLLAQSNK